MMRKQSPPVQGNCNETDGVSTCTLAPGHDGPHYDERIDHEFEDED